MSARHFILVAAAMLASCQAAGSKGGYGAKVRFAKSAAVAFPDFTVIYLGETSRPSPAPGVRMTFRQFEIDDGKAKQKVSWSSGMGDIGPAFFTAAGKRWQIELRSSDKLGKLRDDEMVVSPAR